VNAGHATEISGNCHILQVLFRQLVLTLFFLERWQTFPSLQKIQLGECPEESKGHRIVLVGEPEKT